MCEAVVDADGSVGAAVATAPAASATRAAPAALTAQPAGPTEPTEPQTATSAQDENAAVDDKRQMPLSRMSPDAAELVQQLGSAPQPAAAAVGAPEPELQPDLPASEPAPEAAPAPEPEPEPAASVVAGQSAAAKAASVSATAPPPSRLVSASRTPTRRCDACGNTQKPSSKFCTQCGIELPGM
jgi:hypothetical protein